MKCLFFEAELQIIYTVWFVISYLFCCASHVEQISGVLIAALCYQDNMLLTWETQWEITCLILDFIEETEPYFSTFTGLKCPYLFHGLGVGAFGIDPVDLSINTQNKSLNLHYWCFEDRFALPYRTDLSTMPASLQLSLSEKPVLYI